MMKQFKIAEPRTIGHVTSLSPEEKNYRLMAGGTDLLGEIKDGIIEPAIIIDLKTLPGLSYINKEKDGVRIGALTRLSELGENALIKNDYPALYEAVLSVSTPQLRNMGTIGGNLCQRPRCWYYRDAQVKCRKKGGSRCFALNGRNKYHAILGGSTCYFVHPSDLAPALISLDADVIIATSKKDKTVSLADFYTLPSVNVSKETILEAHETVKEIRLPLNKKGEKSTYVKLKERGTWDFALVSAAVKGMVSRGVFKNIKIVLGGVAPVPWRFQEAEALIKGKKVTDNLVKQASREALKEARPLKENAYKKDLVETVLSRAVYSLV
jgi:xanthine dehydrogenase YagS FAD-binding subunit